MTSLCGKELNSSIIWMCLYLHVVLLPLSFPCPVFIWSPPLTATSHFSFYFLSFPLSPNCAVKPQIRWTPLQTLVIWWFFFMLSHFLPPLLMLSWEMFDRCWGCISVSIQTHTVYPNAPLIFMVLSQTSWQLLDWKSFCPKCHHWVIFQLYFVFSAH